MTTPLFVAEPHSQSPKITNLVSAHTYTHHLQYTHDFINSVDMYTHHFDTARGGKQ